MGGRSRGMTPDEELADLQKKYALLEGDRKAYYETSQWTIKQNRETLAAAKRENKELRETLARVAAERASLAHSKETDDEVSRMHAIVADLRRRYDELHKATLGRQKDVDRVADETKDLEMDKEGLIEETPMQRHIRMLENRLDKSLVKYNEAQSIRKTYEQIVKRLKEERMGFDNQLAAIERTLKAKEHDLEELILMSHDANHAKEVAKAELAKIDMQLQLERAQRDREMAERRSQVRAQQEQAAAQQKRDAKKNSPSAEEEEAERDRKAAAAAKAAMENQEKAREEEQKRITTYEEAFRKMKDATGVDDVNDVIQKYLTQGSTYDGLMAMKGDVQSRIDRLVGDRNDLKAALEEARYSGGAGNAGSRRIVDEIEAKLTETGGEMDRRKGRYEKAMKVLIAMKAGTGHLADKLEAIKLETPNLTMTDENIVPLLAQCELKLLQVLSQLPSDDEAARLEPQIDDMPTNNMRINPYDTQDADDADDDEDDEGDEGGAVLDRSALKTSAQQLTTKQKKKHGGGAGSLRMRKSSVSVETVPPQVAAVADPRRKSTAPSAMKGGKSSRGSRPDIE